MEGYQLKLNRERLQSAYESLTIGELYTYVFIVFSIKNGISASHSKRYKVDEADLYESLKIYGYQKSEKTFFRHLKTLKEKDYVTVGKDKSRFFDVHHKHIEGDKESFVLINYADMAFMLKKLDQKKLKFFIGYTIFEFYFSKKRPSGKLKSKARLERKVLKISNRKQFYSSKKEFEELRGQKCNRLIEVSDHLKSVLSQKCNHIEYKTAINENKKSVQKLNFRNFKISYHTIHLANWHRKKVGKRAKSYSEIQNFLDELSFALEKKYLKLSNIPGFIFHHLKSFETSVLTDDQISEFKHLESGVEKNLEQDSSLSEMIFSASKQEREPSFRDKIEAHPTSVSEKQSALEELLLENPILKSCLNWDFEKKEKSGFYKRWLEKLECSVRKDEAC